MVGYIYVISVHSEVNKNESKVLYTTKATFKLLTIQRLFLQRSFYTASIDTFGTKIGRLSIQATISLYN